MALDWLPAYPDRPPRPADLRGAVAQAFAYGTWDPIINPPPPTELTWHPTYPDRAPRPHVIPPSQRQFLAMGPIFPLFNMQWVMQYPARAPKPSRLPIASRPAWFGPNFAFLEVPKTGGWRPMYPDLAPRPRPLVKMGQTVYPIQPLTILIGAPCVEWDETSLVRPMIDAEIVTRSTMTCDTHDAGFLLLEDGGFLLLEDGGQILLEDQSGCVQEAVTRSVMDEEDVC